MKRGRKLLIAAGVVLAWSVGILGGFKILGDYANTPATNTAVSPSSQIWPSETSIKRAKDRPTLVMFLHPECPCSRASVSELDSVMAKTGGKAKVYAVFIRPEGFEDSRVKGALWRRVTEIPGVEVLMDGSGDEARQFGARTSGQVFLYGSDGGLGFEGGITPARGHEGDSPARQAAIHFIRAGKPAEAAGATNARVFGCSLFSSHRGRG